MPITGPDILLWEKRDHLAIMTMNRPERMNALSVELGERISAAEEEFATDDNLWVMIVTGAGDRSFSAGMDLKDFAERRAQGLEGRPASRRAPAPEHFKPIIAAVNGIAYGGGFERSLACDIRICSDKARFALPEVKRGLIPGSGVYALPRTIGRGMAMYFCITGQDIDAQEAYRLGIVSKVVPHDKLMDEAIALGELICENGPLAVRTAKQIVKLGSEVPIEYAMRIGRPLMDRVFASEDSKEGATAFAEKRKPNYIGR